MGSKNTIAKAIVDMLPSADTFVDMFAGGCAVTHAALLSGKFKTVVANDLDGRMVRLFSDALAGRLAGREREWVSREDFFSRYENDAYVAVIWCFGGTCDSYIYGRPKEATMRALHEAVVFGEFDGVRGVFGRVFANTLADALNPVGTLRERRLVLRRLSGDMLGKTYDLNHLTRADRVDSIADVRSDTRLVISGEDYRDVTMPSGTMVVYCDPPYENTHKYGAGFDHNEFCRWAASQPYPLFISEYSLPTDSFVPIWETSKRVTISWQNRGLHRTERVYTQKRFANVMPTQASLFSDTDASGSVLFFS